MTQSETDPADTARGRFARVLVGAIEVFALADGRQPLPLSLFTDAAPDELARLSTEAGFSPTEAAIAINVFAVRTDGRTLLIDAGCGASRGSHVGHVPDSLRAAGIDPAEIDTVLMTHMHGDHAGGLLDPDGRPAYPNATLILAEAELAFWRDPGLPSRAPDRMQPTIRVANAALDAYGQSEVFAPGAVVAPGITAIDLAGHTPGQTGYLIESEDDRLFVWADIIHLEAVQFPHPEWTIGFDVDGERAAVARKLTFEHCAAESLPVAGMHLDFPGIGQVVRDGSGYRFSQGA